MNLDPYIYNGTLIWTMTTNGYKFLTLNLIRTIERTKVPWRLLVVACDKESYVYFRHEGIPVIQYENAQHTREMTMANWGSANFRKYNEIKLYFLNKFAKHPQVKNCIFMDGDIVVFRNFVPDILQRLEAKPDTLLFQCDEKKPEPCDLSGCQNCCTGFIAWKQSADKDIFNVNNPEQWNVNRDDQFWVNTILHKGEHPYETLPRELYPNGAYISGFANLKEPFLLHFNHRVGNSKIVEMKRLQQWVIPY